MNEVLQKLKFHEEIIEKSDSSYRTIKKLVSLLKATPSINFKGLLVDYIQVKPEYIYPVVDLAIKGRLFTLIVEKASDAQKIIKMNQEIRGSEIQVFALELHEMIFKAQTDIPLSKGVKPMKEYVNLIPETDPRIHTLLDSIISRTMIVKSMEIGIEFSSKHRVTCITSNFKIIYPGSFLLKAGAYKSSKKRIEPYQQVMTLSRELDFVETEKNEIESNLQRV